MTHLERRKSVFYFRIRIPRDLQRYFGRQEIRRSLKVRSLTQARRLLKIAAGRFERLLLQMRYAMLTDAQIRQLAQQYLRESLAKTDEVRLTSGPSVLRFPDGKAAISSIAYFPDTYKRVLEGESCPITEQITQELIQAAGLDIQPGSLDFLKLRREVARMELTAIEINEKRDMGDYSDPYYLAGDAEEPQASQPSSTSPQRASAPQPAAQPHRLLSQACDGYIDSLKVAKRNKKGSRKGYAGKLNRIVWAFGDQPIAQIDEEAVQKVRKALSRFPAHMGKKKQYQGKSLEEVLAMEAKETIGRDTVNEYVRLLKAAFEWAKKNKWIANDPTEVLYLEKPKKRKGRKRMPYTLEELQKIVDSLALVSDQLLGRPERLWVPLIGMYSGARCNEICQLLVDDLSDHTGIWHFIIMGSPDEDEDEEGTDDQSVKTEASNRLLPIHPTLLELGLLDYWRSRKDAGGSRLFEHCTPTERGHLKNFANWWNGQTRVPGFNRTYISTDRKKVFHSLRHNATDAMKQAKVEKSVVDEILGHTHDNLALDTYSLPYVLQTKLDALEKIDYGINLDPIRALCRTIR